MEILSDYGASQLYKTFEQCHCSILEGWTFKNHSWSSFLQTPNRKDFNMNIDKMEFTAWMERIMNRLDILSEDINGTRKQHTSIDGEELLDNQDLLQMLKISPRSLQRYRSSGKLPYYTISGKLYYKLSDIHQFLRECFTTPISKTKAKK